MEKNPTLLHSVVPADKERQQEKPTFAPEGTKLHVKYVSGVNFSREKAQRKRQGGYQSHGGMRPEYVEEGDTFDTGEKEVELVGISPGLGQVGYEEEYHAISDPYTDLYVWVPTHTDGFHYRRQVWNRTAAEAMVCLGTDDPDVGRVVAKFVRHKSDAAVDKVAVLLREQIKELQETAKTSDEQLVAILLASLPFAGKELLAMVMQRRGASFVKEQLAPRGH